jgi:hypothetical protein
VDAKDSNQKEEKPMNFKKVLAGACAGAMVLSTFAVPALADISGADDSGNYVVDVASIIGNADISEVYGVKVTFTEDSVADMVANGAGGGFIFSTNDNNWNQLQWCNGCGDNEGHDIQLDVDTNSITRMEETPFFTAENISGADGTYGQIALSQWWGNDIAIDTIELLDQDGNVIDTAEEPTEAEPSEVETSGQGQTRAENGVYRLNLYNPWTSDDNDMIVDPAVTDNASKLIVTFTVEGLGEKSGTASINFSAGGWGPLQYWDADVPENLEVTNVELTEDGTYTIAIATIDGSAIGTLDFADIQTNIAANDDEKDLDIPSGFKLSVLSVETVEATAVEEPSTDATEEETTTADATEEEPSTDATEEPSTVDASGNDDGSNDGDVAPVAGLAFAMVAALGAAAVTMKKRENA